MSCEREMCSTYCSIKCPKKNFRWRAIVIQAKYKHVLSEKGGGVFALSQWITRTRLSRSLEQATMLVNKNKGVSHCKEKKLNYFLMQSLHKKILFFCFTAIAGLPRGWKPSICPLREEDFPFFPLCRKENSKSPDDRSFLRDICTFETVKGQT